MAKCLSSPTGKLHSNYGRGSFAFARSKEILQVVRPRFHRRGHLVHRCSLPNIKFPTFIDQIFTKTSHNPQFSDGSCEYNPNQGRRRQARRQQEEIIPKSVKVTLQFRVVRFARFLKKERYAQAQRMGTGAPIYMASVLEYLAAEVLELAGNAARDNKKSRIVFIQGFWASFGYEILACACLSCFRPWRRRGFQEFIARLLL